MSRLYLYSLQFEAYHVRKIIWWYDKQPEGGRHGSILGNIKYIIIFVSMSYLLKE